MKKYITLIILAAVIGAKAQVGINNPLPDSTAVLDLSGSANELRGVLFPQTQDLSLVGAGSPANGLIIRDSASKELFIYYADSSAWFSINSWREIESTNKIYTLNKSIGIGTSNPTYPLQVSGAIQSDSINTNKFFSTGIVSVGGTNGRFRGNGSVPQGTIVMWSGLIAEIPTGWAICDGTKWNADGTVYNPGPSFPPPPVPKSVTISPNLEGKFIVGYDGADADYNTISNTGGLKNVTLTAAQSGLPAHNHSASVSGTVGPGKAKINTVTSITGSDADRLIRGGTNNLISQDTQQQIDHTHSWTGTVTVNNNFAQNASQSHENRPPYFTLAYIIKLY
jgi:microcystin-dependent protein